MPMINLSLAPSSTRVIIEATQSVSLTQSDELSEQTTVSTCISQSVNLPPCGTRRDICLPLTRWCIQSMSSGFLWEKGVIRFGAGDAMRPAIWSWWGIILIPETFIVKVYARCTNWLSVSLTSISVNVLLCGCCRSNGTDRYRTAVLTWSHLAEPQWKEGEKTPSQQGQPVQSRWCKTESKKPEGSRALSHPSNTSNFTQRESSGL